jgi:low affinity Fe/Cu permease
METKTSSDTPVFEKISGAVAKAAGSTAAFLTAIAIVIAWLIAGPIFKYSATWQLAINTFTTITTFLMVFLIQRSQNKDSVAIHLKLNELVVAHDFASNRLVAIESLSEDEMKVLQKYYKHLAELTIKDIPLAESHSISEATARHHRQKDIKARLTEVRSQGRLFCL